MISKPENFGKIILSSAAQRNKTLHEEKDKGDAKTITLLHNQVFLAPQRNCTKSQIHRRPGCQGPKLGKHTEPFLRVTGTESSKPGLLSRDAALREPAAQAYITSVCSVPTTATKGPPAHRHSLAQGCTCSACGFTPLKTSLEKLNRSYWRGWGPEEEKQGTQKQTH